MQKRLIIFSMIVLIITVVQVSAQQSEVKKGVVTYADGQVKRKPSEDDGWAIWA